MTANGATRRDPEARRIGAVLRGRYQLVGVLGAGGMATVYLATHRNGHRVALKVLRPELSGHPQHRERFVREAYVANSLDHPGAVRVLDDDVAEDGCPFLVMELLHGETLEARARRCGPLAAREVLAIGHALCDVLARAHAVGVVHRDIKPENIFLTTRGELKILDFGIARVQHDDHPSSTRTGHMMGTPAYMPPEQALGRRHAIDGRSDLWSVGATMFALIAGRPVHHADTPEEIVVRSATVPAPPLRDVAPDAPPDVAAVVDRALAFFLADRYPDAAAMQAALAAAHLAAYAAPLAATPLPAGLATPIAVTTRASAETFVAETLSSEPGTADTAVGADTDAAFATAAAPSLSLAVSHPLPDDPDVGPALSLSLAVSRPRPDDPDVGAALSLSATRIDGLAPLPEPAPPAPPAPAPRRRLPAIVALTGLGLAAAIAARLAAPSACTTHADCATDAGPGLCRQGPQRCVPLVREHCRLLADDVARASADTLWIGAMYPIRDPDMAYGRDAARDVELALRDFTGLTGGLPSLRPGGPARPIGVILCDDTTDHAAIAGHLVDVVGVPAILGFGRSKEVLELAHAHFVPKGVLALASNTAAMLSSIPHPPGEPRLVYRVTTSATMSAPPSIAALRQLHEPGLRAAGGPVGPAGPLRVALVRSPNASGTSHTDALLSQLAATRPAGAREEVRAFVVDDEHGATSHPGVAADVAAFAPHVVIDAGAVTQILLDLEAAWTAAPRPRYIYGGLDPETLRLALARSPDLPARMLVVGSRDSPVAAKVRAHHVAAFGGDDPNTAPYDAFYVLAYAAIALGDEPVTGRALARSLRRLVPPGAPIEVGPAGIYPALKELARGGAIDLQGTLTDLDFDPETGDPSADFAVFCVDPATATTVESGAWYDAATRSLTGAPRCP